MCTADTIEKLAGSRPKSFEEFVREQRIYKLLEQDRAVLGLLANQPFPDGPPRYVRAERYRYRFTRWGEAGGAWWSRTRIGEYLPPLSRDDPALRAFLIEHGW